MNGIIQTKAVFLDQEALKGGVEIEEHEHFCFHVKDVMCFNEGADNTTRLIFYNCMDISIVIDYKSFLKIYTEHYAAK